MAAPSRTGTMRCSAAVTCSAWPPTTPTTRGHDSDLAWTWIRAVERTPDAMLDALRTGAFYASAGPAIHDVVVDDDVSRGGHESVPLGHALAGRPARLVGARGTAGLPLPRASARDGRGWRPRRVFGSTGATRRSGACRSRTPTGVAPGRIRSGSSGPSRHRGLERVPPRQSTRCVRPAPGAGTGSRGSGSSLRQSGEGRSPRSSL